MTNGTIAFDTLSTSGQITGTAKSVDTDFLLNGSAKAFGSLDMANSNTIKSSFNVSTFTDRGDGSLYGNYTNNMGSATDCVCVSGITSAANGSLGATNGNVYSLISGDTTARYSQNVALVSNNSMTNEEAHQGTVFGDLA